jgi:D-beta-D-heptose 7-phosphate kinase/D-beta-D-heptose 1-phosphate adenosyltransferase
MRDLTNTPQQTKFRILLIGDSCVDEYKIGTVDRISPEAPVPIIKNIQSSLVPGMAANVRVNLEALGLSLDFVTNTEEIRKTRYIDKRSKQQILRVDSEPHIQPWSGRSSVPISEYDAVVISDYNKGFLTYELIEYVIEQSKSPVFIDTKKDDLGRFSNKSVYIKINETEYKNLYSYAGNLIVTLGDQGAMFGPKIFPVKRVEVTDVCGCGDTFLAALVYKFLLAQDISAAIDFANRAGSVTVQHHGNYAPNLEEIENA